MFLLGSVLVQALQSTFALDFDNHSLIVYENLTDPAKEIIDLKYDFNDSIQLSFFLLGGGRGEVG